jgi:hypothetical protein
MTSVVPFSRQVSGPSGELIEPFEYSVISADGPFVMLCFQVESNWGAFASSSVFCNKVHS